MENINFNSFPKLENDKEELKLREDIPSIEKQLSRVDRENEELQIIQEDIEEMEDNHWIDFEGGDLDKMEENGFKHGGPDSYLISPISEKNWTSDHYFNCTAVIGIGRDINTEKEISFMTHQKPEYFVDGTPEQLENFARELSDSLKELKEKSQENTIEITLSGGNFSKTYSGDDFQNHHYQESIKKINQIVKDSLGFNSKVIAGPNNNVGSETVVTVETQKRKIWIEKTEQDDKFNQSFQSNNIEEMVDEWNK